LGVQLNADIRQPDDAIELGTGSGRPGYIRLRGGEFVRLSMRTLDLKRDAVQLPDDMVAVAKAFRENPPTSLASCVAKYATMAEVLFKNIDTHYPALFLFDENWRVVGQLGTQFQGQSDKFIFWYHVADRVVFANARAVIWIAEAWKRDLRGQPHYRAVHDLPIIGELLQVSGIDRDGNFSAVTWNIRRGGADGKPRLELEPDAENDYPKPFFFAPIERAFEKLRQGSKAAS
jgi:hypothetical protein